MNLERFKHPQLRGFWLALAYLCLLGVVVLAIAGIQQARNVNDRVLENQKIICGLISLVGAEHSVFANALASAGDAKEIARLNAAIAGTCPRVEQ